MTKYIEGNHLEVTLSYSRFANDLPDTVQISSTADEKTRSLRVQSDLDRKGYSVQVWDNGTEEWEEINFVDFKENDE